MWVAVFGGVSSGVADNGDRSTFGCAAVVVAMKGAIAKCGFLGSELPSHWRLGALPLLQASNPGKGQALSSALLRKVMFARTESPSHWLTHCGFGCGWLVVYDESNLPSLLNSSFANY